MGRSHVAAIAAVIVLAMSVSACSNDSKPATAASDASSSSGHEVDRISWRSCGGGLQCATLKVPLDYSDPKGPTITLALNMRPARKKDERIGALLINPGGPGGSGLQFNQEFTYPDAVRDHFDIIGFDPRGVGQSTALHCATDTLVQFRALNSTPSNDAEQQQLNQTAQSVAEQCGQSGGALLAHLGTDDVARDVDSIRVALGEDQISFDGESYGTFIGLRLAALFPQDIRAMVLDGVVDPTQDFRTFLRQQTIAFETAIDKIFAGCASGPSCPPGGAAAAYDAVVAKVEQQPIPTKGGGTLDPGEVPVAALIPTYDPTGVSLFYTGLTDALNGDGTILESLFEDYETAADYAPYAAVECTDSPHPVGADDYAAFAHELEQLSPRFGGAVANELLPCAFWPAPVHDVTGPVVAPASAPILVVGNTGDAATPYQQAESVAKTLAHGRLLTLDGPGHTALDQGNDCINSALSDYLVNLTLPADGAVCK